MQPEDQRDHKSRYTVIPRTLVFLTQEDQILLLKGAPSKKLWANRYNGLGGHIEPQENPYEAAKREVWEESGLRVKTLTLRAVIHVTLPEPPGVMLFVFVGKASTTAPLKASEEGSLTWVRREDLDTLPLVDDLPQLLPRILEPGDMTFGHYHFTKDGLQIKFA